MVAKNGRAEKERFLLARVDEDSCGRRNTEGVGTAMATGLVGDRGGHWVTARKQE